MIPFPTFSSLLSPKVAILIDSIVALSKSLNLTDITATSFLSDVPFTVASTDFSFTN